MADPPLLTLSDVTLNLGTRPLFRELSLAVHPGERIALVGRNGAGKSTLLRVMAGIVEPDSGTRFTPPGVSIGYMEQEPDFTGHATLGDFAAAGLPAGEEWRVAAAAEGLGLAAERAPEQASGGERRRAALVRILAQDPALMLLDEPTNHLDIAAIAWLESHLARRAGALVVISHDRAFLRALSRAVLWIDRGRVRRLPRGFAHFEDWRDRLLAEEAQALHRQDRLIRAESRWAVEGISARRKRNQGRLRRLQALRAARAAHVARPGVARMALETGERSGRLVIEAEGISKRFGEKAVVRDFSVRIARGDRLAIVGPNGAGKTTLVNMLIGRLAPDTGRVRLGTGLRIALFDQNRARLDPDATLWDTLTGDAELGVSGRGDQVMVRGVPRHVVGYLKDFLFDEHQARGPVRALSGGEKARLLLALLMARPSNLLVLDEPTNDLDIETLDLLQELLSEYDGTVILVSHDRDFLDRVASLTVVMDGHGGATLCAGGWSDAMAQIGAEADAGSAAGAGGKGRSRAEGKGAGRGGGRRGGDAKSATREGAPRRPRKRGLTYVERHRLKKLPAEIDRLEAEIARLTEILSDPELFARDPARFDKATRALAARQAALSAAEEEWLQLAARAEEAGEETG